MANPTLAQEQSMRAIQPSSPLIPPSMQQLTQAEKQISQQTGLTSKADIAAYLQEQARINEINARNKADYEKQLAEYNSQVATQNAIQRDLNLLRQYAEASGSSGTIRYDASVGSLIQGLMSKGLSEREIRDYYEGIASSQTAYQLASKYAGIRAEQKAIIAQLPKGEKPIWNTFGQLQGIESSALGRTFNLSGYNQAVQSQQIQQATIAASPNIITTNTGKPYGTLTPTISEKERYLQSINNEGIIHGTLSYFSSALVRGKERLETYVFKQGNRDAFYGSEQTSTLFSLAPNLVYFTPVGPSLLMLGGAEQLGTTSGRARIKEQINILATPKEQGGKGYSPVLASVIGYGSPALETTIGLFGLKTQYKNAILARDIKNAQTTFIAQEKPLKTESGATIGSKVSIISRTKIGKDKIFEFKKQIILDKETPTGDLVRVGESRGFSIAGEKPVVPIDFVSKRFQAVRDFFVSKEAGEVRQVKQALIGTKGTAIIDLTPAEISMSRGRGVVSSARIIGKEGDIIKASSAGGFEPIAEGKFSYMGGSKPRVFLTPKGLVLRTPKNIRGLVFYKAESEGSNIFGGRNIQVTKQQLSSVTKKTISEEVLSQRVAAIEKAKEGIIKVTESPLQMGGVIASQIIYPKQKEIQKQSTITLQTPRVEQNTLSRMNQISSTKVLQKTRTTQTQQVSLATLQSPRTLVTPLSSLRENVVEKMRQGTNQTFSFPGESITRPPTEPTPFEIIFPRKEKKIKKKERAYKVYILKEATKPEKKRWQLVGAELPLITALSFGAEATSKDISRRFKVIPEAEEVQPKNIVVKTFEKLAPMFRSFSQKGGVKIALPKGEYIQKAPFSLSSREERKQIQQARRNKLSAKLY